MIPMFLYMELNCFAIAILLVIYLNMRSNKGHYTFDQKLFLILLVVNTLLLFLDLITRVIESKPGYHIRIIFICSLVIYNILNPIICIVWYYYVDYYIYNDRERIGKVLAPMLLPVLTNAFLSIASIFFNIYFILDDNNNYYRGRLIPILLLICLYIVAYTNVFLIRNRSRITRKELFYLLFFAIIPSLGGILQFMFSGIHVIWIAATLSILIIFINLQKDQMFTDYLTGVNNRRCLDNYLRAITKNLRHESIAGIMIDIDDFKMINDVYGHDHGDQALKYTAQILKKTFRKADFIARYGGDEFIVVMKVDKPSELPTMVQRLTENVSTFNSQGLAPYEIALSVGYDSFNKESGISTNEFLQRIDRLMYLNKKRERENSNNPRHGLSLD